MLDDSLLAIIGQLCISGADSNVKYRNSLSNQGFVEDFSDFGRSLRVLRVLGGEIDVLTMCTVPRGDRVMRVREPENPS